MTHKGTLTLETERLILRRFAPQDAEPMFRNWVNDPEVTRFLTWQPHGSIDLTRKISLSDISKYEDDSCYQWAIELKSLGEPIGGINVVYIDKTCNCFEVAYRIGKAWWHQGFASEALSSVIRFLFENVGANRIAARYDTSNPNSGAVMRKCGMSYEGTLRQSGYNNQGVYDAACYAILADDYFNRKDNQTNKTRENIVTIRRATELMFQNMWIAMQTVDWNTEICGAPAWRYIYHTLHSADKYFINPMNYTEPPFQIRNLDWPDTPSDVILSRETLFAYYEQVRQKILDFLDGLTEEQLIDCPNGKLSKLGLICSQFRHMYAHIGILNGVTIARTNQYPRVLNESRKRPEGLYDTDVRE